MDTIFVLSFPYLSNIICWCCFSASWKSHFESTFRLIMHIIFFLSFCTILTTIYFHHQFLHNIFLGYRFWYVIWYIYTSLFMTWYHFPFQSSRILIRPDLKSCYQMKIGKDVWLRVISFIKRCQKYNRNSFCNIFGCFKYTVCVCVHVMMYKHFKHERGDLWQNTLHTREANENPNHEWK